MWNETWVSMELARNCCWPKYFPSLSSIFRSFNCLSVKIGHGSKSSYSKLNHEQSSRSKLTSCPNRGVCSDSNWTAQLLQMVVHKSLGMMSGMILNLSQPKFGSKWYAVFERHVVTSFDRKSFNFLFAYFFLAICLHKQSSPPVLVTNHS